jgi:large-conductance mechanosensitive channel
MDTNPTPAPSAASDAKAKLTGYFGEFGAFLRKTNALVIAIGICLGAAVKDLVDAFVYCFIQPIIDLVKISSGPGITLWIFQVGLFLTKVINFVIIAWVLFMISKWFIKEEKKPA